MTLLADIFRSDKLCKRCISLKYTNKTKEFSNRNDYFQYKMFSKSIFPWPYNTVLLSAKLAPTEYAALYGQKTCTWEW